MYFDTDEALQLAVNMEALRAGKTVSEFLAEIVREQLPEAIAEAERTIQNRTGPPPRPKPGRKPRHS